jgi:16S rRNA (guanine966-N2)-methyltransferase
VTRIIGGVLGSLRLKGPAKATRPTSDRVKESIFSILESRGAIQDARVLDLFAGTGALGLEAASRGASRVVFVEADLLASHVIHKNVETCRTSPDLDVDLKVIRADAKSFLSATKDRFGLLLFDPPYVDTVQQLRELSNHLYKAMAPEALLVVEHDSRLTGDSHLKHFVLLTNRSYGETQVSIFTKLTST